jgi:hypothetical protein
MDEGRTFAGFAVWAVRIVALAIAGTLLWWSSLLERTLQEIAMDFQTDWDRYWLIQAVYLVAGIGFAVAVRFPFPRSRYAWGRILIAGIVILPAVHLWYALSGTSNPLFLRRLYWFDSLQGSWSILAGVAIEAGFGARRPA